MPTPAGQPIVNGKGQGQKIEEENLRTEYHVFIVTEDREMTGHYISAAIMIASNVRVGIYRGNDVSEPLVIDR